MSRLTVAAEQLSHQKMLKSLLLALPEYVCDASNRLCFKLPHNVSLEEWAMYEPLSVGVYACRRANIGPYTNVLVMGAGPIGLVTMLAARTFGAPRIMRLHLKIHDK
ncbi:sorbitol dehydrogenase [Tanacetum coccineum]